MRATRMVETAFNTRKNVLPMRDQKTPLENLRHRSDFVRKPVTFLIIDSEVNLDLRSVICLVRVYGRVRHRYAGQLAVSDAASGDVDFW